MAEVDALEFLGLVNVKKTERHGDGHGTPTLSLPKGYRERGSIGQPLCELSPPPGGSAELILERRTSRLEHNDTLIHEISQISEGFVVGGYTLVQR